MRSDLYVVGQSTSYGAVGCVRIATVLAASKVAGSNEGKNSFVLANDLIVPGLTHIAIKIDGHHVAKRFFLECQLALKPINRPR
jgi:hypothetical protein